MAKRSQVHKVQLDAVNRKGRPVLGVKYTVSVGGKKVCTATKGLPTPQRIEVKGIGEVTVKATLAGWRVPSINVGVGTSNWKFLFAGAGVPRILIVCALAKEVEAVLATCDAHVELKRGIPTGDPNIYWVGTYRPADKASPGRTVLVATCGMGTIGAAITATHALRSFPEDIEQILMVGIAGGCPNPAKPEEHVRLGDIVVANEKGIVQYDFVKRTVAGDVHRANPHRPSKEMSDAAVTLEVGRLQGNALWDSVIQNVGAQSSRFRRPSPSKDVLYVGGTAIAHPADPSRKKGKPRVHRGGIGSANILLKDPTLRDIVRDKWDVRAIEMEGSGVLDAGWAMNMDVMVVRGICDYCDAHKNDDWQTYAALTAAAYARCLVEALPDRVFP